MRALELLGQNSQKALEDGVGEEELFLHIGESHRDIAALQPGDCASAKGLVEQGGARPYAGAVDGGRLRRGDGLGLWSGRCRLYRDGRFCRCGGRDILVPLPVPERPAAKSRSGGTASGGGAAIEACWRENMAL